MMGEEKMYPIKVLVEEYYCKRDQFQIFKPTTVYWGRDPEREIIFSRLGRILSSIKFPFSVEVALGVGSGSLQVILEKVRGQRISFNGGREHCICLFNDSRDLFRSASDFKVKKEFLQCFATLCRECIPLFSKEEKVLRLQAERERNKASVLRDLEIELLIGEDFSVLGQREEFWWD